MYQTACTVPATVSAQRLHAHQHSHSAQKAERSPPTTRTRYAVGRATARPPARAPSRSRPAAAPWTRAGPRCAAGRAAGCRAPGRRRARRLRPGCCTPTRRGPPEGRPRLGGPLLAQPARVSCTSELGAQQIGLLLPHGCDPEQGCLFKRCSTVGGELQRPPGEITWGAETRERWALGDCGTCTAHAALLCSAGWLSTAGCAHALRHSPLSVNTRGWRCSVAPCVAGRMLS
jgi:hypothetical protein